MLKPFHFIQLAICIGIVWGLFNLSPDGAYPLIRTAFPRLLFSWAFLAFVKVSKKIN